ncbi:hypothetical protein [Actinoplanes italicus]|uniref:hypothetical protein n=1 Tax=Actinoplanes italicus TaxID=113567 RepID=UPI0011B24914|nr:hypothetical protein [Actinoplanes italicus]
MPSLVRATVVVLVLLGLAACDGAPSEPPAPLPASVSSSATAFTPPPLRLPQIAPGAACPAAAPRPWTGPGEAGRVFGDGPLYPIADYFRDGIELELRPDDRQPNGTYVKKVRWIGAGYSGPVLVRAGRIDAPGAASASFSYVGEERDGGHYAELTRENNDLPATTTVAGPGCYAYQVDGATFSITIVFQAVGSIG